MTVVVEYKRGHLASSADTAATQAVGDLWEARGRVERVLAVGRGFS